MECTQPGASSLAAEPRPSLTEIAIQGEGWLRAVWETSADAMALSDPEGTVLAVNPAYCELYGYGPEELVRSGFEVIFAPEERDAARAAYRVTFSTQATPPSFESAVQRKDGTTRVVESRIGFITTAGERV